MTFIVCSGRSASSTSTVSVADASTSSPPLRLTVTGYTPGGYRVARVKANPDCVQLSAQNRYGTTVMHRAQPVRVQPRFAAQVVRIHRQHLGGRGINDRLNSTVRTVVQAENAPSTVNAGMVRYGSSFASSVKNS